MIEEQKPPDNSKIDPTTLPDLSIQTKFFKLREQEIYFVSKDKILLWLSKHERRIGKSYGWVAPLGIFITITITLVTSRFEDIGLGAPVWKAIFVLSCMASFVWLLLAVAAAHKSVKVEDIVEELKRDSLIETRPEEGEISTAESHTPKPPHALDDLWKKLLAAVEQETFLVAQYLRDGQPVSLDQHNNLTVKFTNPFYASYFEEAGNRTVVEDEAGRLVGRAVSLIVVRAGP